MPALRAQPRLLEEEMLQCMAQAKHKPCSCSDLSIRFSLQCQFRCFKRLLGWKSASRISCKKMWQAAGMCMHMYLHSMNAAHVAAHSPNCQGCSCFFVVWIHASLYHPHSKAAQPALTALVTWFARDSYHGLLNSSPSSWFPMCRQHARHPTATTSVATAAACAQAIFKLS